MHQALVRLIIGFDWDSGNLEKNWRKHQVSPKEAEEVFINAPLLILGDEPHSGREARYHALGKTEEGRKLFVAFALRSHLVRIISARPMSRMERRIYEKEEIEKDS